MTVESLIESGAFCVRSWGPRSVHVRRDRQGTPARGPLRRCVRPLLRRGAHGGCLRRTPSGMDLVERAEGDDAWAAAPGRCPRSSARLGRRRAPGKVDRARLSASDRDDDGSAVRARRRGRAGRPAARRGPRGLWPAEEAGGWRSPAVDLRSWLNGKVVGGQYCLGSHGRYVPVSFPLYVYSAVHGAVTIITVLAILAVAVYRALTGRAVMQFGKKLGFRGKGRSRADPRGRSSPRAGPSDRRGGRRSSLPRQMRARHPVAGEADLPPPAISRPVSTSIRDRWA